MKKYIFAITLILSGFALMDYFKILKPKALASRKLASLHLSNETIPRTLKLQPDFIVEIENPGFEVWPLEESKIIEGTIRSEYNLIGVRYKWIVPESLVVKGNLEGEINLESNDPYTLSLEIINKTFENQKIHLRVWDPNKGANQIAQFNTQWQNEFDEQRRYLGQSQQEADKKHEGL